MLGHCNMKSCIKVLENHPLGRLRTTSLRCYLLDLGEFILFKLPGLIYGWHSRILLGENMTLKSPQPLTSEGCGWCLRCSKILGKPCVPGPLLGEER